MKQIFQIIVLAALMVSCKEHVDKKINDFSTSSNTDSIIIKNKSGYAYFSDYESENYHKQWETKIEGDWLNYSTSTSYKDFLIELNFYEKNSDQIFTTKQITFYDEYLKSFYIHEGWKFRISNCDDYLDKATQYRIEWRLLKAIPYIAK
jgi:hypothetical protein